MPLFKALPTGAIVGDTDTQTLTNKTLSNPAIVGTATNDNAAAGNVGEYVYGSLASGSATSLVSSTAKTVISISLTAGDWDVAGSVYILPAATTSVTFANASVSLTTNSMDLTAGSWSAQATAAGVNGGNNIGVSIPPVRFSLSATTSIFLVANAGFTVSTCTAWGSLRARRVR